MKGHHDAVGLRMLTLEVHFPGSGIEMTAADACVLTAGIGYAAHRAVTFDFQVEQYLRRFAPPAADHRSGSSEARRRPTGNASSTSLRPSSMLQKMHVEYMDSQHLTRPLRYL